MSYKGVNHEIGVSPVKQLMQLSFTQYEFENAVLLKPSTLSIVKMSQYPERSMQSTAVPCCMLHLMHLK